MTERPGNAGKHRVEGLEHVPTAAVVCDAAGQILQANQQFTELSGKLASDVTGIAEVLADSDGGSPLSRLTDLAGGEAGLFPVLLGGQRLSMYVIILNDLYLCGFIDGDATRSRPDTAGPSGSTVDADTQLLAAFIRLSEELNLAMREEDLVKLFADVYQSLLPSWRICIRLLEPEREGLALVYANGRLREGKRETLRITAESLAGIDLVQEKRDSLEREGRIVEVENYEPVFIKGEHGFELPLCDRETFYGILNFEYAERVSDLAVKRHLVVPLAHQMTAALRNARLLSESVYLKNYLEKLLDHANAPVIVLNAQGRITVVNQAMERQTKLHREEILSAELMTLVPESDQARLLPRVNDALRGHSSSNLEMRIPKADGSGTAHIAFNTATILSPFGEVEGVIFIGQDLTEVRQLQKQIIHSEKLATLGQVAAGVAHELNNPLTSITVYTNYLLSRLTDEIDEADTARLRRILHAAERIQSFTKDLVTYARPAREEPTLIQLDKLIEHALSFCEHLVGESGADVTLAMPKEIPSVFGIRGQLEQVFVNLLTNSCHAMPEDGGSIVISVRSLDDAQVQITIEDSGHGIAEEHLGEVFEPFFTTKDRGEGTGLGLSIARNIIDDHKAKIDVESMVGSGTKFIITMFAE